MCPKTGPRRSPIALPMDGADLSAKLRRANIFFQIVSPTPGTFVIALHYKGREKAILEMDLKIDDLVRSD